MIDPFSQMKQEYGKITVLSVFYFLFVSFVCFFCLFVFFSSGISVILILKYGIAVSF